MQLERLVGCTPETKKLFDSVKHAIYSITPPASTLLGYPDAGHVSTYYPDSPTITQAEVEAIKTYMEDNSILVENTRLSKVEKGGTIEYHLLLASAEKSPPKAYKLDYTLPEGAPLEGRKMKVVYGDHSKEMGLIAENCQKAALYAANDTQKKMMEAYYESFYGGSLEAHRESQKFWVKDIQPKVEVNLGFIETYRDPAGVRGEWEGFVSMVNEERTKTFGELVRKATEFIPRLPWGKDFEQDKFLKPDFTSLEGKFPGHWGLT